MTELSFLLELLLNHKLQKPTKDLIQTRIKEIEAQPVQSYPQMAVPLAQAQYHNQVNQVNQAAQTKIVDARGQAQSPSMARAIAEMEAAKAQQTDLTQPLPHGHVTPISPEAIAAAIPQAPVAPVAVIAQTPATAQALADRNAAIMAQVTGGPFTGKPSGGMTGPRKF
jgi:hypothetical protein